jgi:hypothetical protein
MTIIPERPAGLDPESSFFTDQHQELDSGFRPQTARTAPE